MRKIQNQDLLIIEENLKRKKWSGFYVACDFDILLNANFTKSSHVIAIGT